MNLNQCRIVDIPRFADGRGYLGVIESQGHAPFEIKRIYFLYGVPDGSVRGEHGHRELEQLIVAMAGSFEITLDDGHSRQTYELNSRDKGLYVAPMMWRTIQRFSTDAVCLVAASAHYDEADYFRDYDEYLRAVGRQ